MVVSLTSLRRYRWLASLLVVAYSLRALIPTGFMPGGDGSLSLQICPEGFPAALLPAAGAHAAHHHHIGSDAHEHHSNPADASGAPAHDHKSWMAGHCAFGAAASAALFSESANIALPADTGAASLPTTLTPAALDIRFRIAQPRAPPRLA